MFKLLQLGMVLHSKLSYLETLPPNGTLVCSLTISLSGGSAWNRSERSIKRQAEGTCQSLKPTGGRAPGALGSGKPCLGAMLSHCLDLMRLMET